MNNRKSPNKDARKQKSPSHRRTSPMAANQGSSPPAVPLFYSNNYAEPPDCSFLPPPPESWYTNSIDEVPVVLKDEEKPMAPTILPQKPFPQRANRQFNRPFSGRRKFPTPCIAVKA